MGNLYNDPASNVSSLIQSHAQNQPIKRMFDMISAHTLANIGVEVETSARQQDLQQQGYLRISYQRFLEVCGPFINDQHRAVRLWSPDFVPFASPLIACGLIGPASAFAVKRPAYGTLTGSDTLCNLEATILGFVLRRFSDFWPLGTCMESEFNVMLHPQLLTWS